MDGFDGLTLNSAVFPGITFGGKHTFCDWGLVLLDTPIIPPPTARTNLVEIPGGNGYINMTEALAGEPTYTSREKQFKFRCIAPRDEWQTIYSKIANHLHGREMNIILDEDSEHYYTGVCILDSLSKNDEKSFDITIKSTIQPFRYDSEYTTISNVQNFATSTKYISLNGVNNSMQDWNTDLWFGSEAYPECNIKSATNLIITYNKGSLKLGNKVYVSIVDFAGKVYAASFPRTAQAGKFTISVSDISAKISSNLIYRITVSGVGNAKLSCGYTGKFIEVDGCACTIPVIVNSNGATGKITANNVSKNITSGINEPDGIVIKPSGTTLVLQNLSSTGTIDILYRKAWI